jgi:predicted DNA-binding protein with PD1-like motif
MILTLNKTARHLVGRFDRGDDLLERLNAVAKTNNIQTATFSATGYLEEPEFATYLPSKKAVSAKKRRDGAWFISSLRGSISMRGSQREVSIQAHLLDADGKPAFGFLTAASVLFIEIVIDTVEDSVLVRDLDPELGISQWMGLVLPEMLDLEDSATGGRASAGESDLPAISTRRSRAPGIPSFLLDDEDLPEVFKGDFLEHPSLGKCKVVNIHEDDRVTVILPQQGKLAEINLEFFSYKIIRKETGRQYIRLTVKRA